MYSDQLTLITPVEYELFILSTPMTSATFPDFAIDSFFDMVHTFNHTFKAKTFDSLHTSEERQELQRFRNRLITEEYNELLTAVEQQNPVEVVDALMDLLYVIIGAIDTLGPLADNQHTFKTPPPHLDFRQLEPYLTLNAYHVQLELVLHWCQLLNLNTNRAFKLVHTSNMTKMCTSLEEANATAATLQAKNIETYINPVKSPKHPNRIVGWVVYRKSDDKVCKSINYSPVNLKDIKFDTTLLNFSQDPPQN